jgi:hypothetical protein
MHASFITRLPKEYSSVSRASDIPWIRYLFMQHINRASCNSSFSVPIDSTDYLHENESPFNYLLTFTCKITKAPSGIKKFHMYAAITNMDHK